MKNSIKAGKLLPIISLEDASDALPLALALVEGGIKSVVIDINSPSALDSISVISKNVLELSAGVCNVRTYSQVRAAAYAHAAFVISSSLSGAVVRSCQRDGIFIIPSVITPSEVERAKGLDTQFVCFCPASVFGGAETLRFYAKAFPDMEFLALGGITVDDFITYHNMRNVLAIGGNFIVPPVLVEQKKWEDVTAYCVALFRCL